MAERVREYTDEEGRPLIEYDNGMIRRADNGYIVKPGPGQIINDGEKSRALHRARKELKRAIVREVASENAKAEKYRGIHGDAAYIAAITEQITIKALNPADPKQVDAARFLMREGGDSEDVDNETQGNDASGIRSVIADIARIAGAAVNLYAQKKQDNERD